MTNNDPQERPSEPTSDEPARRGTDHGREHDLRDEDRPISEGEDGTVDDWFGQNAERDREAAEAALRAADGDPQRAAELFDGERPVHLGEEYDVPADERPGNVPGA